MRMELYAILIILFIHWVADFVFQDVRWSNKKHSDITALLTHTADYSYTFLILGYIIILFLSSFGERSICLIHNPTDWILFVIITFITHTIIDYITSKITHRKREKGDYGTEIPNTGMFSVIGFDQLLHQFQLIITYVLIF